MLSREDRDALKSQLIAHEGLRLRPYTDTVGKLTIGVGRNLIDKGLSRDEADYLLEHDISDTINGILQAMPWVEHLDAPRFRVLVDVGFNAGIAGLLTFHRMLAAVQKRDYETAAKELIASKLAPARAERLAALMRS